MNFLPQQGDHLDILNSIWLTQQGDNLDILNSTWLTQYLFEDMTL
jgi:hypothetical protein